MGFFPVLFSKKPSTTTPAAPAMGEYSDQYQGDEIEEVEEPRNWFYRFVDWANYYGDRYEAWFIGLLEKVHKGVTRLWQKH